MKELITKKDEYFYHTNDLTREMDDYLVLDEVYKEYAKTYIRVSKDNPFNDHRLAIRHPGATRGEICFDDNMIITNIELYDDEYHTDEIYRPEVREIFKKYIGTKLVIC